jgi:hypothetical protein
LRQRRAHTIRAAPGPGTASEGKNHDDSTTVGPAGTRSRPARPATCVGTAGGAPLLSARAGFRSSQIHQAELRAR